MQDRNRTHVGMSPWKIIGMALLIPVVISAGWGLVWVTADLRGATEAREQTRGSGDFRLAAYEHFFSLCTDVQSQEGRIEALLLELETDPSSSRIEQINASLTAVRAQRTESINEYNNDATATYTRGQFRDSDLPYQLDPDDMETECVTS